MNIKIIFPRFIFLVLVVVLGHFLSVYFGWIYDNVFFADHWQRFGGDLAAFYIVGIGLSAVILLGIGASFFGKTADYILFGVLMLPALYYSVSLDSERFYVPYFLLICGLGLGFVLRKMKEKFWPTKSQPPKTA